MSSPNSDKQTTFIISRNTGSAWNDIKDFREKNTDYIYVNPYVPIIL